MPAPVIDLSFPHHWQAEVLASRPLILPQRHFVYPREVEEIERGALEVLVQPESIGPAKESHSSHAPTVQPFLATCGLGFRDPAVPSGVWSCPQPEKICAVAGGYAYLIDTSAPEQFSMIAFRPVLEVRSVIEQGLLLFVGHQSILAWGARGEAWQSEKVSDEGVTLISIEKDVLRGMGWHLLTDKETPFALDLRSGLRVI
ncbi:MAG TPA: hypothetical protein VK764_11670 [Terracidiphilus sp.]|nr:hypothetical protein [Terracidiphilus sp.]